MKKRCFMFEMLKFTGLVEGSSVLGDVLGYEVVGFRVPMIGACEGLVEGAREGAGIPQDEQKSSLQKKLHFNNWMIFMID